MRDRRIYPKYDVRLRALAMSLEQYRTNCVLYADKSPVYVKDSGMYRASSPRAALAPIIHGNDDDHGVHESYAAIEEQSLPIPAGYDPGTSGVRSKHEMEPIWTVSLCWWARTSH